MNKEDELICSFMGYEREWVVEKQKFWYQIPDPLDMTVCKGFWDDELPFFKSWDYLIEVVKLAKYVHSCSDMFHTSNLEQNRKFEILCWSLTHLMIPMVYDKVVELIKCFNENKQLDINKIIMDMIHMNPNMIITGYLHCYSREKKV